MRKCKRSANQRVEHVITHCGAASLGPWKSARTWPDCRLTVHSGCDGSGDSPASNTSTVDLSMLKTPKYSSWAPMNVPLTPAAMVKEGATSAN